LLKFNNETQAFKYEYQNVALELLSDAQANPLLDTQVNDGVSILKDRMACEFKGFTHRLNTQAFDNPHIGLNGMEQGNIIHLVLQYFYQEITISCSVSSRVVNSKPAILVLIFSSVDETVNAPLSLSISIN
jgi:ATP-dependent helicase/DNAse subunit B